MNKTNNRRLREINNDQSGMTGLETAIILISFVTVAAVFAYAILSAGLFSAERAKETHYEALREAKSNLEVSGSLIATSTDSINVNKLIFSLKNAAAGYPINLTSCDGTTRAATLGFHKYLIGHWHVPVDLPLYDVCPSPSGTDAYDRQQGRMSKPAQTTWLVHHERGEFDRTVWDLRSHDAEAASCEEAATC